MRKTVHVAFITDKDYVLPTSVAIASLKKSKDAKSSYCIHVLCDGVRNSERYALMSLSGVNFKVETINVKRKPYFEQAEQKIKHVSHTAFFKFELPNLFPRIDKMLYLDGDVLAIRDVSALYDTDIDDYYAAVVKDMRPMLKYSPPILEKLGCQHKAYFNSGMMLLNLKKMRDDAMTEKLVDYRLNGVNFFTDQDALNVCFDEKVKYLHPYNNWVVTMDSDFVRAEVETYHGISGLPVYPAQRWKACTILHVAGLKKPWRDTKSEIGRFYIDFCRLSPFFDVRELPEPCTDNADDIEFGCNSEPRDVKIVMSLTTIPARIEEVSKTLLPLMKQTMKPDRILLWLTPEEFPGGAAKLPKSLLKLTERGLEIKWGENLRPHTKYYHTFKECPNDIVITVDDDVVYSHDLVARLYASYKRFPNCVSALRAHLMTFMEDGTMKPYRDWVHECGDFINTPLMSLFATGVGGVLYPPGVMPKETLNRTKLVQTSLYADDVWLKSFPSLARNFCLSAALRMSGFVSRTLKNRATTAISQRCWRSITKYQTRRRRCFRAYLMRRN